MNKTLRQSITLLVFVLILVSCREPGSIKKIKLDYENILKTYHKDNYLHIDNTDDIDYNKIIINNVKEGLEKLEVEERNSLLELLEAGSLNNLESELNRLSTKNSLGSKKKAQAYYLLGRVSDVKTYMSPTASIEGTAAYKMAGELDPANPDLLELEGRVHNTNARLEQAIEAFNKAIEYIEKREMENTLYMPQLIRLYRIKGASYSEMGEQEKGLETLLKGLTLAEEHYKGRDEIEAEFHEWIATAYYGLGKYDEALEHCLSAEKLLLKIDKNSPSMGDVYNRMGLIYKTQKDSKAREYYQRAIDIKKAYYGAMHRKLTVPYNNMALYYRSLNDFESAVIYHKKALTIVESNLKIFNAEGPSQYRYIADTYSYQKEYGGALEYYEKSLEAAKKAGSYYSLSTTTTLLNLSSSLIKLGLYRKSLDYLEEAVQIILKSYPPDHIELTSIYTNMGVNHAYLGDNEKAITYYMKSINIYESNNVTSSPDLANTHQSASVAYYRLNSFQEAYNHALPAYEMYLEAYGEEHPKTASAKRGVDIIKEKL